MDKNLIILAEIEKEEPKMYAVVEVSVSAEVKQRL